MQPQFITKPAFAVVGLHRRATPKSPAIPALWDQFVPRMGEIPHQATEQASYGVMDNYDHAQGEFDYIAGNPVDKVGNLPAGMVRWEIPANTYAVFETSIPKLGETFDFIYGQWLPTSDYQQTAGPYFERYGEDFRPDNPVMSVYISVEKRG
jgi:AraC family transcriptional regulator